MLSLSTTLQTAIRILRPLPCRPLPPGFKILPDDEDDEPPERTIHVATVETEDGDLPEQGQEVEEEEEEEEEEEYKPTDPITLCNEFDRTNAVNDLRHQLERAGFTDIDIVPISLRTVKAVIERISKEAREKRKSGQELVVFQLCDGTGFYKISNSKPVLKRVLQAANVNTSVFQEFITAPKDILELEPLIAAIGFPMIVKPSISYASLNITMSSVVHTREQLLDQIKVSLERTIQDQKEAATESSLLITPNLIAASANNSSPVSLHVSENTTPVDGQSVLSEENVSNTSPHHIPSRQQQQQSKEDQVPSVFVEKFLAGREFTALCVGDKDWGVRVFPVAERVFDSKLGKYERLLAFDKYWEGYDLQGGQGNEDFCRYACANDNWQPALQKIAMDAYLALQGNGYGRVDIRTSEIDVCDPVVLEVNANCGLSFEKALHNLSKLEAVAGGAALALSRLEGEVEYFKELFDKLKFSYLEQDSKEKFLNGILKEPPLEIKQEDNEELEAKNMETKKMLEDKVQQMEDLRQEIAEVADSVCRDHAVLEKDIIEMTKMLWEMKDMEAELAALKSVEDKYSGMTVKDAQALLEDQTEALYRVNQEIEETTSKIQDLKWQSSQLAEQNQTLAQERAAAERAAKQAVQASGLRQPHIELLYKQTVEASTQLQEDVGLESIHFDDATSTLVLVYQVSPSSSALASIRGINNNKASRKRKSMGGGDGKGSRASTDATMVRVHISCTLHPESGKLVKAKIDNTGCPVQDIIEVAKARNDIPFLVYETLDRVCRSITQSL
ncbi:hypothetical protein BGW42_007796 [Actinomortierella wolfii]|nr:hypothetical protein BGW42_007796 [Actinomortierella wolfii]